MSELVNYDTHIIDKVDTENEELTESEERVVRDIKLSTRRKLGTGYFNNSSKTFADMFRENFDSDGVSLDTLVERYASNYCFVFNVQHKDHRMITPDVSRNTLVKVYKTKTRI